jgi:hypothetical protein
LDASRFDRAHGKLIDWVASGQDKMAQTIDSEVANQNPDRPADERIRRSHVLLAPPCDSWLCVAKT